MQRPSWVDPVANQLRRSPPGRLLLKFAKILLHRLWPAIRRRLASAYHRLWPARYVLRDTARRSRKRLMGIRYETRLRSRKAAGDWIHTWTDWKESPDPRIDLFFTATAPDVSPEQVDIWCRGQTLEAFRAVGLAPGGEEKWRIACSGVHPAAVQSTPAPWFYAPGTLPEAYPAFLESALLVALAEDVDAVVLLDRLAPLQVRDAAEVHGETLRPFTLFHRSAYRFDPKTDSVVPTRAKRLFKIIGDEDAQKQDRQQSPVLRHRHRRGPYLATYDLGPRLEVPVRDAGLANRWPPQALKKDPQSRPSVMVLAPFLAHGGAEHTIFETLRALTHRFHFFFVTLAPHQQQLGDRRSHFEEISPRIYSLGDLVHPVVMPGLLSSLINTLEASIVYNANGTTLFYDFAEDLKAKRPNLRILDHLYDHQIGYIDRYFEKDLRSIVDTMIAENHRIAERLIQERQWKSEDVPVIWPCGRRADAFPSPEEAPAVRRSLRQGLGFADSDLIFLTAARMHPQKRPLDLVKLAERLRDLPHVHFLIVGGGALEDDVDRAIAEQDGSRIRRLPFRQDIPELITACDVGCLVSDYEGLPVFMIECLQSGRPFLGTRVGEMGRVLQQTGAGLVVEKPGDLAALEDAVRRLIDDALRSELSAKAHQAAHEFAVVTCAERYAHAFLGWSQSR